ncbi:MAG TPA: sugar transferase [Longimicrobiaceae bacterium]|nr:sugar transferase [Longimicrobiaceae bacterium]
MAMNLAQPTARPIPAAAPREHPLRRAFDVAASVVLLLIAAPLLLIGMAAVLIGSGRPIFFGHVRVGRGGRPFRCWKLRTMAPGAEAYLAMNPALRERHARNGYKLPVREDPRVTRVGRWLRHTHLDELPQLVNVLGGTMSLVGPRPVVEDELAHYGDSAAELLTARPGLVGAWTSRGRRRPPYPERARLELAYVRTRSLLGDLRILALSIPVVLQFRED